MTQTNYKTKKKRASSIKITEEYIEKYFPVYSANSLDLNDNFLNYKPFHQWDKRLKDGIILAITSNLPDFRMPIMDPSIDENGNIFYEKGNPVDTKKLAVWWEEALRNFMPEKNSRMANFLEWNIFLAYFIKYLIEKQGYTIEKAWHDVCFQKLVLADFWPHPFIKVDLDGLEDSGSNPIGNWYDLGNTQKFITDTNSSSGYSCVGVNHFTWDASDCYLGAVRKMKTQYTNKYRYGISVGLLSMDV